MARVRSVGGTRSTPLSEGWQVASAPAGTIADATALAAADAAGSIEWTAARVPSTAASSLRAAGRWTFDDRVDFDAADWWWRTGFSSACSAAIARVLRFGGLATLAEVWLNGTSILKSDDMFLPHEVDVGALLRDGENELVVVCRSLGAALGARRPRPRWKTRLVEAQQLRWFRTALVGRIPAWTPPAAPVGPWLPIVLEEREVVAATRADLRARLDGSDGVVEAEVTIAAAAAPTIVLHVGETSAALASTPGERPGEWTARGSLRIAGARPWWPHTHGEPARTPASLSIATGGREAVIDLGP